MHLPWRDMPPGGDADPISTSLLEEEAQELRRLAAGRDVLEIGSAFGFSACVMALAGARKVTAVDPHDGVPGSLDVMRANVSALPDPTVVDIVQAPSQLVMADLSGQRFGLVFVDGDHRAAAVEHDVTAALRLLGPGGVLAVHDFGEDCCCPDVKATLNRLHPGAGTVTGTLWVRTS